MTFKINDVDYSDCVARDSITVDIKPIIASSVVTLDGITHNTITRWRSTVHVRFFPLDPLTTKNFCLALREPSLQLTYDSPYYGTVTQNVYCNGSSVFLAIKDKIWKGGELVFEQL